MNGVQVVAYLGDVTDKGGPFTLGDAGAIAAVSGEVTNTAQDDSRVHGLPEPGPGYHRRRVVARERELDRCRDDEPGSRRHGPCDDPVCSDWVVGDGGGP